MGVYANFEFKSQIGIVQCINPIFTLVTLRRPIIECIIDQGDLN